MAGLIIAIVAAAVAVVGSIAVLGWWLNKRLKPADAGALVDRLNKDIEEVKAERDELQEENSQLISEKATAEANAENLKEQQRQLDELLAKLETETKFHLEKVTKGILTENKQEMKEDVEQKKKSIDAIVQPLKDNIADFRGKMEKIHEDTIQHNTKLTTTVEELQKNAKNYGESADNLAKALTGGSKLQGNWGEVTFQNLIEDSGLQPYDYVAQPTMRGAEGAMLRPDFLIKLPEHKYLIVDAKVSLRAYQEYMNGTDEARQETALVEHVRAVENHVKELSAKRYESVQGGQIGESPDFVFMFMPIEHSFLVALKKKPQLFQEAYSKNVILCVPSSAMAVLRTVQLIWRQERQSRNVEEISRLGGQLYDKLAGFVETMEKVMDAQEKARDLQEKAYGQLKAGRGNVLRVAEQMRAKGVKVKKILPEVSESEDPLGEVKQAIGES